MATHVMVTILKWDTPNTEKILKDLKRELLDNSTLFLRVLINILVGANMSYKKVFIEYI